MGLSKQDTCEHTSASASSKRVLATSLKTWPNMMLSSAPLLQHSSVGPPRLQSRSGAAPRTQAHAALCKPRHTRRPSCTRRGLSDARSKSFHLWNAARASLHWKFTGGCIFMTMSVREAALSNACNNLPKRFGSGCNAHSETPTLRASNSGNTAEIA